MLARHLGIGREEDRIQAAPNIEVMGLWRVVTKQPIAIRRSAKMMKRTWLRMFGICSILSAAMGCAVVESSRLQGSENATGSLVNEAACPLGKGKGEGGTVYYLPKNLIKFTITTGGYLKPSAQGGGAAGGPSATATATSNVNVAAGGAATPAPASDKAAAKESPKPAAWADIEKMLKDEVIPEAIPDEVKLEVLPAIPDLSQAYVVRQRHRFTRSDDWEIKTTAEGLLTSAKLDTKEETPAIILELSKIAVQVARIAAAFEGVPVPGGGRPFPSPSFAEVAPRTVSQDNPFRDQLKEFQKSLGRKYYSLTYQRVTHEFVFDPFNKSGLVKEPVRESLDALKNGIKSRVEQVRENLKDAMSKAYAEALGAIDAEATYLQGERDKTKDPNRKAEIDTRLATLDKWRQEMKGIDVNALIQSWFEAINAQFGIHSVDYAFDLSPPPGEDVDVSRQPGVPSVVTDEPIDGILYRRPATYLATLKKMEGSASRAVFSMPVVVPSGGAIASIPFKSGWFVTTSYNVGFDKGYLTSLNSKRPSELLGFFAMWPEALKNIASIPGEILQVKIDYSNKTNSLIESNNKTIELQNQMIKLLQEQQALLNPAPPASE